MPVELDVVAMVNGELTARSDPYTRLKDEYGEYTLDEMSNGTLIRQAARKVGVTIERRLPVIPLTPHNGNRHGKSLPRIICRVKYAVTGSNEFAGCP